MIRLAMRRKGFVFVLAAATGVLAFGPRLVAANTGVPLAGGDKATASIDVPGDQDSFLVGVTAGGTLSAKIKGAKGGSLLPDVQVLKPDSTPVSLDGLVKGSGKPSIALKPVPAPVSGSWAVVVSGAAGTTGDYEISVSVKEPKGVRKGLIVPNSGTLLLPFSGTEGALLGFSLKEVDGAALAGVEVVAPDGGTMDFPGSLVTRKGAVLKGANIPLVGGVGLYSLRLLGSSSGATQVDAKIKVKIGKDAKRVVALGPEPRPASFTPTTGPDTTSVVVTGTGFVSGAAVFFGDAASASATVDSDTQITCTAPKSVQSDAGAGVSITVLNPDGQAGTAPGSFAYLGIPAITSASPAYQPLTGGSIITVEGNRFRSGFSLSLGGVAVPGAVLQNSTQITFNAPAHAEGSAALAITDEFGRTVTLNNAVQYVAAPTVSSASPASSSFTGGRAITLTGTRYRSGIRVFVAGVEVLPVTVLSATSLRFAMPAGTAGSFGVEVRDDFGQSNTYAGLLARRGPFVAKTDALPTAPAPGVDFFGGTAVLGDLDGDDVPDLVLSTAYPPYVYDYETYQVTYYPGSRLLINDGTGGFTDGTADRHGTFSDPGDFGQASAVALGDLDGDDRPELLLSLAFPRQSPNYSFLYNGKYYAYYIPDGQGGYRSDYRTYPATRLLGNDGYGYFANDTADLPTSTSTPLFQFGERLQASASAMGDLDGDDDLDVVLVSTPVAQGYVKNTYTGPVMTYLEEGWTYVAGTRVLRNTGGTLATVTGAMPSVTYTTGNNGQVIREDWGGDAVALGDLDGDGDLDMVVARSSPAVHYVYNSAASAYYIYYDQASRFLRNGGAGTFTDASSVFGSNYAATHKYSYDYGQADCVALGDLDGDGDLDVVLGKFFAGYWYDAASQSVKLDPAIRILRNGGGTFTEATSSFLPDASFRTGSADTILSAGSIQIGDLDGDSFPDLVVAGSVYNVYDYAYSGYGYYGLMPSGYRPATRILINDGTGVFKDVTTSWMPTPVNVDYGQSSAAVLGDLDGDGDADLVLSASFYPYSSYGSEGKNRPLRVLKTE